MSYIVDHRVHGLNVVRQAKVCQLELCIFRVGGKQKVLWLQVAVHDMVFVAVLNGCSHRSKVVRCSLGEPKRRLESGWWHAGKAVSKLAMALDSLALRTSYPSVFDP